MCHDQSSLLLAMSEVFVIRGCNETIELKCKYNLKSKSIYESSSKDDPKKSKSNRICLRFNYRKELKEMSLSDSILGTFFSRREIPRGGTISDAFKQRFGVGTIFKF